MNHTIVQKKSGWVIRDTWVSHNVWCMFFLNENNKSKTKRNRNWEGGKERKKFGRKEDGVITIDVEIHLTQMKIDKIDKRRARVQSEL